MSKNNGGWYLLAGTLGVVAVTAGALFYMAFNNQKETKELQAQAQTNYAQVSKYQRLSKNLTVDNVLDTIVSKNVKVQDSLDNATEKMNKAIDMVYNKTKTDEDYDNLKGSLPDLVGKEMADKLIELDKPAVNQSGKKTFPFGHIEEELVTFGNYNYNTTTVPVYVAVAYKSPKVLVSGNNKSNEEKELNGQDLFVLTYNLKTRKFTLDDYQKGDPINE